MKYKPLQFKIENGMILSGTEERIEPQRTSAGECYYCNLPVWVSEGQALKYKVIIQNGERTEYPTHKRCRKLFTV